jgi:hypothetical protein
MILEHFYAEVARHSESFGKAMFTTERFAMLEITP